ncbi:MAG: hypothetical protein AABX66_02445 [Nanoarchaeota archaeon]
MNGNENLDFKLYREMMDVLKPLEEVRIRRSERETFDLYDNSNGKEKLRSLVLIPIMRASPKEVSAVKLDETSRLKKYGLRAKRGVANSDIIGRVDRAVHQHFEKLGGSRLIYGELRKKEFPFMNYELFYQIRDREEGIHVVGIGFSFRHDRQGYPVIEIKKGKPDFMSRVITPEDFKLQSTVRKPISCVEI